MTRILAKDQQRKRRVVRMRTVHLMVGGTYHWWQWNGAGW